MKNLKQKNEQKILELLYSGEPANDLLAFEIIRSLGVDEFHIPAIIYLLAHAETEEEAEDLYDMIKPFLNRQQRDYLRFRLLELKGNHFNLNAMAIFFDNKVCAEIAHIHFKRTEKNVDGFLFFADGSNPNREEAYQFLLDNTALNKLKTGGVLEIPSLYHEELEFFLNQIFEDWKEPTIPTLKVFHYRSTTVPKILFSKKYDTVYWGTKNGELLFPDFIFGFKEVKKLEIELHKNFVIPNDWSALEELKELKLLEFNYVIPDMNFIYTMPKIKKVDTKVSQMIISKYLLDKIKIEKG